MRPINLHDELLWAAGFFDGEGSTNIVCQDKRYRYLRMSLTQVEPDPIHRFYRAIGSLGKIYGPYPSSRPNTKPLLYWMTRSDIEAIAVVNLLWPHLSLPKKIQATVRIIECAASRVQTRQPKEISPWQ